MKVAVTVGVYNEEKNVKQLIKALLKQTRLPEEVIFVDDGSTDKTGEIVKKYAKKHSIIKYFYQENAGPACARNKAWRNADADICIFTDGDCIPEKDWIEELLKPFKDKKVGATGGTYKTLNNENILARFVGLEIAWKYRNVKGEIDSHGTYNLAVRKKVLEEVGGMDESYPKPSGEDWDMTYKISRKYRIIFVSTAIVSTEHFEKFGAYMKNQIRRGYDRIKLYNDCPDIVSCDVYTSRFVKYQVLVASVFFPSCIFFIPIFKYSFFIPLGILSFMFFTALLPFGYFFKKDPLMAFYSIPVIIIRNFAWATGMVKGVFHFGIGGILKNIIIIK